MKRWLAIFLIAASSMYAASPVVVLPERFAGSRVIVKNSPEYRALEKRIVEQLAAEHKTMTELKGQVDKVLQDRSDELDRLRDENAKLKAANKPKIPIWSILSTAVSFISNPFGFLVSRAIQIALAAVVILILYYLFMRFVWKRTHFKHLSK